MPENDETTTTENPDKPPISEAKLRANRAQRTPKAVALSLKQDGAAPALMPPDLGSTARSSAAPRKSS